MPDDGRTEPGPAQQGEPSRAGEQLLHVPVVDHPNPSVLRSQHDREMYDVLGVQDRDRRSTAEADAAGQDSRASGMNSATPPGRQCSNAVRITACASDSLDHRS